MLEFVYHLRRTARRPLAGDLQNPPRAGVRREAERQLEWAEIYLAAAERIDLGDPGLSAEIRELRGEVVELRRSVRGRPGARLRIL